MTLNQWILIFISYNGESLHTIVTHLDGNKYENNFDNAEADPYQIQNPKSITFIQSDIDRGSFKKFIFYC